MVEHVCEVGRGEEEDFVGLLNALGNRVSAEILEYGDDVVKVRVGGGVLDF